MKRAGQMVQLVKVLTSKPDDLSSVRGTHDRRGPAPACCPPMSMNMCISHGKYKKGRGPVLNKVEGRDRHSRCLTSACTCLQSHACACSSYTHMYTHIIQYKHILHTHTKWKLIEEDSYMLTSEVCVQAHTHMCIHISKYMCV